MRRILVTGAAGFLGRELLSQLVSRGHFDVRGLTRREPMEPVAGAKYLSSGDISLLTEWQAPVAGIDVIVHAAGRAHLLNDSSADPLTAFRRVNVKGTLKLAQQAAAMGVRRFVFLSSVGVNGVQTASGKAFKEADQPQPHNAYALSKWEAEQGLLHIANETELEVVIIRPPLVYGRNAPGNFGSLQSIVRRGYPLPLGSVHNQRSLVALDNLVDFIVTCITHPQAANQTFLVSDGQDLSTTELVRGMAQAAGVPARLLPVPVWALQAGATLMGKGDVVQRLCGNLQVDISKARSVLGWVPPVSVEEGLRRAMAE